MPSRRIVKTLLVLIVSLIGSVTAIHLGVNSDRFRRWLESEISRRTGYAVGMRDLRLTWPIQLAAEGVTAAKDGKRILSAAKVNVTVTPFDIYAKTIHRLDVEKPVLEIDLAEFFKSRPKSDTTVALRNLNVTDGRAVIRIGDGKRIEIPALNLAAQNINLGDGTGAALRADIPALGGITDLAIAGQDSEITLDAKVTAKQPNRLFGGGPATNPRPNILNAKAALRMPLGLEPTIDIDLRFNQFKLGSRRINGQFKTTVAMDKIFTIGRFSSELDLNGFPNSISPVALPVGDGPMVANAKGVFSVTDRTVTVQALTMRSHLGNAEASGSLAFIPVARINDGRVLARNLDWQKVKKFLPAPFSEWRYQGEGELEMKLRGPWSAVEIEGVARGDQAQVRAANFALASFSLRAPFRWANGQLAVQNGRIDAQKFSFEGPDQQKSSFAQAGISAISYDSTKPGRVTVQVKLIGGQFASADSSKVAEGVAFNGTVEMTSQAQRKNTTIITALNLTAGEILWGKFFGDLKTQKPQLRIDVDYARDHDRLECRRGDLTLAAVGRVILAGSIEQISQTPKLRLQVSSDNLSPAGIFEFFLRETYNRQYPLLDKLAVSGQMAMQLQLDGAPERLALNGHLSLKNGGIVEKSNIWQISAINFNLPLQIRLDDQPVGNATTPALGSLSIEHARFGNQQLAPITTTVSLANNALRLHQPLRLSLFGGEIELRNLAWPDIIRDPKAVTFSANAKGLQLRDLTGAFNWPRFSGQLNGSIPQVESAGNTLRTRGEIQAELFGGRLILSKLEIEDPFSALASIKMSAKLESIELEQLSKTFAFGRISGILEGTIDDLVITDGQPAQLRADVHSVERSGVDQRISVEALNKITVLSSGQEAGALYGGLAGFFDSFRYSKLGFKATLRNDRLTLRGVESQGEKELLVVGSFLPPTVNVVSHTQEIAFSELLRRLERIKSEKPAIK